MQSKIVFQTDHLGIYTGQTYADPSPLEENVWLIPGGCVETPPPDIPEFKAARWDGSVWKLIDSYQGLTVYSTRTGEPSVMDRVGELPTGYTLEAPGPNQVWKDGRWVDDVPAAVEQRYRELVQEINAACAQSITAGFCSYALGDRYWYSTTLEDQLNLSCAAALAADQAYGCIDQLGIKAFLPHTAAQLRQVADEFTRLRLQLLQKADSLKARLQQAREAKDLAALNSVTWEAAPV